MNLPQSSNKMMLPDLAPFHQLMALVLEQYSVPSNVRRIALNFRNSDFYVKRSGHQPVEIQLERSSKDNVWLVRFVASFDYPGGNETELDVALYFNFKHQWFYQPDIEHCELARPEVLALFQSWQAAFARNLKSMCYDQHTLTIVGLFNHDH